MTLDIAQHADSAQGDHTTGLRLDLLQRIADSINRRSATRCFPALDRVALEALDEDELRSLTTEDNVFSLLQNELICRDRMTKADTGSIGAIMLCLGLSRSDVVTLSTSAGRETVTGLILAERLLSL